MATKIKRLLNILSKMIDGKTVSIAYLANEFHISRRTVERDVKALKDAGLPIVRDEAYADVKYKLTQKVPLENLKMSMEDEGAFLSLFMHHTLGVFGGVFNAIKDSDVEKELKTAIKQKREISLCLQSEANFEKIEGRPLNFLTWGAENYLLLLQKEKPLLLKTHQITSVHVLKKAFKHTQVMQDLIKKPSLEWFECEKTEKAILRIKSSIAEVIHNNDDFFIPQKLLKTENNGDVLVETALYRNKDLKATILYHLPHITVEEPKWLQAEIDSLIRAYLSRDLIEKQQQVAQAKKKEKLNDKLRKLRKT